MNLTCILVNVWPIEKPQQRASATNATDKATNPNNLGKKTNVGSFTDAQSTC